LEQQAYDNGSANVAAKYGAVNIGVNFVSTKFATAYSSAGVVIASGANILTNATPFTGNATAMQLGLSTFPRALNGRIRAISYYPTRLPNATLQSITS
jgi:hypothetical protein